ncbi:MAG: aromatic-ring-hydroxylating dioxygenase subunit beta [Gammaproteobacteria bacterium]|jgi:salicylate 5-hydroxylase small subunit
MNLEDLQRFYELYDFYARYTAALDDGPLEDWPGFFAEQCLYRIVPRDNYENGYPVAVIRCESRAMLEDRVTAVKETMMYEPRYLRHHTSDLRVDSLNETSVNVIANFSVIEVLPDELPRISMAGRYIDTLRRGTDGAWEFVDKLCVFDSILIPNSIVYPV